MSVFGLKTILSKNFFTAEYSLVDEDVNLGVLIPPRDAPIVWSFKAEHAL